MSPAGKSGAGRAGIAQTHFCCHLGTHLSLQGSRQWLTEEVMHPAVMGGVESVAWPVFP